MLGEASARKVPIALLSRGAFFTVLNLLGVMDATVASHCRA